MALGVLREMSPAGFLELPFQVRGTHSWWPERVKLRGLGGQGSPLSVQLGWETPESRKALSMLYSLVWLLLPSPRYIAVDVFADSTSGAS